MDIYVIVMIIVAAVALLLLWAAATVYWRRRHSSWLKREATRHSTALIAARLKKMNDAVETLMNDALARSFPRPYFPAMPAAELLWGEGGAAVGLGIGIDEEGDDVTAAPSVEARRRSLSHTRASNTAEDEALRTIVVACVRRVLISSAEAAQHRHEAEGGDGANSRQSSSNTSHASASASPTVAPLATPSDLLASLDAAPELLSLCRIAVAGAYGAVGRAVQLEGASVFDDVRVERLVSDTQHSLESLKKEALERDTPHATVPSCCLPLCCTSRRADTAAFAKYRQFFFLAAATRFCSAVDVMETDDAVQKRLTQRDRLGGGGGGGSGRGDSGARYGRRRLGDSDDEDDAEMGNRNPRADGALTGSHGNNNNSSGTNGKQNGTQFSSLVAAFSPLASEVYTMPTAAAPPAALRAFEEGAQRGMLLNMADAISRRMVKVTAFASRQGIVKVVKGGNHHHGGGNALNSNEYGVNDGGRGGEGIATRSPSAISAPATVAAVGGQLPRQHRRTPQELRNEAALAVAETTFVTVADHPDLIPPEATRAILEARAMRRHIVSDRLLCPPGGWGALTPSLREANTAADGQEEVEREEAAEAKACEERRGAVVKAVAAAFPPSAGGLPIVSKSIDGYAFACDGVRDDLIVYFTNLQRNALVLGGSLGRYGGGGGGAVAAEVRTVFPMYDAVQRFDYHCKRWLAQMAVIVASEAARAYYHFTRLRTRQMAYSHAEAALQRLLRHASAGGGGGLPPTASRSGSVPRNRTTGDKSPSRQQSRAEATPAVAASSRSGSPSPPAAGGIGLPPRSPRRGYADPTTALEAAERNSATPPRSQAVSEKGSPLSPLSGAGGGGVGGMAVELAVPRIRVRTPKADRVQQRLLQKLSVYAEACRRLFAECGLTKEGALARGSAGGFTIPLADVCLWRPLNKEGSLSEEGDVGPEEALLRALANATTASARSERRVAFSGVGNSATTNQQQKDRQAANGNALARLLSEMASIGLGRDREAVRHHSAASVAPPPADPLAALLRGGGGRGTANYPLPLPIPSPTAFLTSTTQSEGLWARESTAGEEGGEGTPPTASTSSEAIAYYSSPLLSTIALLEAQVRGVLTHPSLVAEMAADEDTKIEARRCLLRLRRALLDSLCPPAPHAEEGGDRDRQQEGHGNPLESLNVLANANTNNLAFSPRGDGANSAFEVPSFDDGYNTAASSDGGRAAAPPSLPPAAAFFHHGEGGDDGRLGESEHHPASLVLGLGALSGESSRCVYHQVSLAAVRLMTPNLGRLVTGAVTDAEALITRTLLVLFAEEASSSRSRRSSSSLSPSLSSSPSRGATQVNCDANNSGGSTTGRAAVAEWERVTAALAAPAVRRVVGRIALYLQCALLAIHVATLTRFLERCGDASSGSNGDGTCNAANDPRVVSAVRRLLPMRCAALKGVLDAMAAFSTAEAKADTETAAVASAASDVRENSGGEKSAAKPSHQRPLAASAAATSLRDSIESNGSAAVFAAYPPLRSEADLCNVANISLVAGRRDEGEEEKGGVRRTSAQELSAALAVLMAGLAPRLEAKRFLPMGDIAQIMKIGTDYARAAAEH